MPLSHPNCSHPFRRRARTALLFLGALIFLFEEWLWVGFTRLFAVLGRLGVLRWLDARLVKLAPAAALVILCIPIVLLFPVKIAGLWMIASGRFLTGCCVMLAAKILSTAVIARIFLTCRPQLLRMPWFARFYNVACALRDRVHQWMAQQPAWRDAKAFVASIRRHLRSWTRGTRSGDQAGASIRSGVLRRWRRYRRKTVMATSMGRSSDGDRR
jgi:hypothetical protein